MATSLRFKRVLLDQQSSPICNRENKVLCEVLTVDGSIANAFVSVEMLTSICVDLDVDLLGEKTKSSFDISDDECQNHETQVNEPSDETDFIWSSYHDTSRDNEATDKFIEIVTTEPYDQKLKDKKTPKYKVWQQISNELKNLGFIVAENEKEGGKKCDQKWRNLESKYISFKENSKKTGKAARKKLIYFAIMHAGKDKHKVSPPTIQDTLNTSTLCEKPLELDFLESTSQNYATIVASDTSKENSKNIHTIPKITLRPKAKVSPSDILDHMTKLHRETLDLQRKHLDELKINLRTQNEQRQEMLNIFAKLVENTTKKKKRKRSESV